MKTRPLLFAALLVLAGCAMTAKNDPSVPAVTPALIAVGGGAPPRLLAQGREVYTRACAACHAPLPVTNYPMVRWRAIIGDMADRTELADGDRSALLAYLTAATAGARP